MYFTHVWHKRWDYITYILREPTWRQKFNCNSISNGPFAAKASSFVRKVLFDPLKSYTQTLYGIHNHVYMTAQFFG